MPYQGSKWRHRRALEAIVRKLGFVGAPDRVVLVDVGPWAATMAQVLHSESRLAVIELLRELGARDPREVYLELQGRMLPRSHVQLAAEHLFLQRLAYSGKAVGFSALYCWRSPGFNKSSAYGIEATDRFGTVNPMIPSLIATLESYDVLPEVAVTGICGRARKPWCEVKQPTLVYLDPNYQGSTSYPNGEMDRQEVLERARGYHTSGASVMVSEAEPLEELISQVWSSKCIDEGRKDSSRFRGQQEEWVTYTASP
jgi:hypothetical protein